MAAPEVQGPPGLKADSAELQWCFTLSVYFLKQIMNHTAKNQLSLSLPRAA